MQEQKSKARTSRPQETEETAPPARNEKVVKEADATLENIEDVLDAQLDEELLADLDDILEEDAETFVSEYVQKGGE